MKAGAFKLPCDFCGGDYSAGPHRYDGKKLRGYEAWVCPMCDHAGDGGWNQMWEPLVLRYLEKNDLPEPKRLKNGFLPKEFFP